MGRGRVFLRGLVRSPLSPAGRASDAGANGAGAVGNRGFLGLPLWLWYRRNTRVSILAWAGATAPLGLQILTRGLTLYVACEWLFRAVMRDWLARMQLPPTRLDPVENGAILRRGRLHLRRLPHNPRRHVRLLELAVLRIEDDLPVKEKQHVDLELG